VRQSRSTHGIVVVISIVIVSMALAWLDSNSTDGRIQNSKMLSLSRAQTLDLVSNTSSLNWHVSSSLATLAK
jgi:hypothetical protein